MQCALPQNFSYLFFAFPAFIFLTANTTTQINNAAAANEEMTIQHI